MVSAFENLFHNKDFYPVQIKNSCIIGGNYSAAIVRTPSLNIEYIALEKEIVSKSLFSYGARSLILLYSVSEKT